mmetsp:Transcript_66612/g.139059  ORF Transcript_66612/g.139059 Transcript_66612/m.139059 type:complete len:270 (+) Transcript_66612:745-1554(+)
MNVLHTQTSMPAVAEIRNDFAGRNVLHARQSPLADEVVQKLQLCLVLVLVVDSYRCLRITGAGAAPLNASAHDVLGASSVAETGQVRRAFSSGLLAGPGPDYRTRMFHHLPAGCLFELDLVGSLPALHLPDPTDGNNHAIVVEGDGVNLHDHSIQSNLCALHFDAGTGAGVPLSLHCVQNNGICGGNFLFLWFLSSGHWAGCRGVSCGLAPLLGIFRCSRDRRLCLRSMVVALNVTLRGSLGWGRLATADACNAIAHLLKCRKWLQLSK